jgi:hypothetical protein
VLLRSDEDGPLLGFLPDLGRMPGDLLSDCLRKQAGYLQSLLLQDGYEGRGLHSSLLQVRAGPTSGHLLRDLP